MRKRRRLRAWGVRPGRLFLFFPKDADQRVALDLRCWIMYAKADGDALVPIRGAARARRLHSTAKARGKWYAPRGQNRRGWRYETEIERARRSLDTKADLW